ncbi:hypothetical protein LX32DRAFT_168557 [Colletotrichum zoysiae]|uniref:Uncharacterized protein n=1 Tax=Colletotrichum zoysiae TaxID=1216348 RepID=A0AAD9HR39_9PEZI|nr:hypothetical protein LX32DRAFT_168557 [Colletotrichum zoysiae]
MARPMPWPRRSTMTRHHTRRYAVSASSHLLCNPHAAACRLASATLRCLQDGNRDNGKADRERLCGQAMSFIPYGGYAFEAVSSVQGRSRDGVSQRAPATFFQSFHPSIHDSGTSQHGPTCISSRNMLPSSMVSHHRSDYQVRTELFACLLAVHLQSCLPLPPRVLCD